MTVESGLDGVGCAVRGRFCPDAKTELNTSAAKIKEVRRVTPTSLNRASLFIPNLSIVSLVINLNQSVKSAQAKRPVNPSVGDRSALGSEYQFEATSAAGANSVAERMRRSSAH